MPLDRRRFLTVTAAGAAAALAPADAARSDAAAAPAAPSIRSFDLEEASIADLQAGMDEGRWTAREIAAMYLARIREVDDPRGSVGLNSILEINPEALAIAGERDRERKEGRVRGPLHGIPIVVKDNFDTADGMRTAAGSLALARWTPPRDSFVVERLRAAGAVLLGKTNLSEWANFRSTKSSSGWSGRGGQTRNPYALDRNPCGSSSGSGAAVSANLVAAGFGTETDGSVVCPSTANGLVGIKPTLGLLSRAGIVPIAHSQDTAGPMARSVADAAALLSAVAGVDPRDPATRAAAGKLHADYAKFLEPAALKGARIGVARKSFGFHPRVDALMEEAIDLMRRSGATIVDPADVPTHGQFSDSEYTVLLYEFKADLNDYLGAIPEGLAPRTLGELIRYNEQHAAAEMPYFGQEIFLMAEEKGSLTEKEYREALEKNLRLTREEGIDAVLAKEKLDAIIAPTGGPAWTTDLVNGDHYTGGYSSASAVSGYPHVTVPLGMVYGLPVGISFFAGAWSEPALIRLAYAFERASEAREAPRFLAKAELTPSAPPAARAVAALTPAGTTGSGHDLREHCGL
ncbi:MAG TPA: amidase [Thermoanaerobaculia bacterium]|nr:amidase [Thermoanaerobaculia bacterium]